MGVYIKGLQMPQNCYECRFCETYLGHHLCAAYLNYIEDPRSGRLDSCPLVELPDHGDLIDREALIATDSWEWIRHLAPVIIPAERSEEC